MKQLRKIKPVLALGICLVICIASGLLIPTSRVQAAQTKHMTTTHVDNSRSAEKSAEGIAPSHNDGDDFCVRLTAADQGRTVLTTPGEKVIMDLQENHFAGYRWSVSNSDEQVVSLEDAALKVLQPEGMFVSPFAENVARIYTFVAHEPGTTQLQFQYSHYDWHTEAPKVSQQFTVTIQVGEAAPPSWSRPLSPIHPMPTQSH